MTEYACYGTFTACVRYVGTSPTGGNYVTFNSAGGFAANSVHETCEDCDGGINPLNQACIDPLAMNYDSTSPVDCSGTVGGTDYDCCWYGPDTEGCMDPLAVNYDSNNITDCTNLCGSPTCCCWYGYNTCKDPASPSFSNWGPLDCAGNMPPYPAGPLGNTSCCNYKGCTHPAATNFCPTCNADCAYHADHSWIVPDYDCCEFPEPVGGCQNSNAVNYDPNANADCFGDFTNNHWIAYSGPTGGNESCCQYCMDDGQQSWSQWPGTTATNYNATATTDCNGGSGSDISCCVYPDPCDILPLNSPYLVWNSGECKECLNNSNLSINCQCCPDEPNEPCDKCCCEKGNHLPIGEKCAPGTLYQLSQTDNPCECPQGTIETPCKPIPDTWDCIKKTLDSIEPGQPSPSGWKYGCVKRTDGSGQYTNLQDCEDKCGKTVPIGPIDDDGLVLPKKKPVEDDPIKQGLNEEFIRMKTMWKYKI